MENEKQRFRVEKFILETTSGGEDELYLITDHALPMTVPNRYLEGIGRVKKSTGRVYAVKLCRFLGYLDENGVEFENATNRYVSSFVERLVYGKTDDLKILSPEEIPSYSTLSSYVTVITHFYLWLDRNYGSKMVFYEGERSCRPQSYLYGQIYRHNYYHLIDRLLPDTHGSREYIKWYTDEEKDRLCRSFRTLRDESVFRLTLEGFRIDEVLSIRLGDYHADERIIQPSRSKRRADAIKGKENRLRKVRLTKEICDVIDRYLFEERNIAENNSGRVSEVMFINLTPGKNCGLPLSYANFRQILRNAAKRAGFDEAKIRTHSGRSTRVMDVLEYNAKNPETAYSEIEIKSIFGWSSVDSIEPYRNHNSEIMALSAAERSMKDD